MTLERGNSMMPVHAAMMMWPTSVATGAGVVAGGLTFLSALLSGSIAIASPIGWAIFAFAVGGGAAALLGSKGDRRARRWAGKYPWRWASGPAVLAGLGIGVVQIFGMGFFGGIVAGVATGAVIWVILGLIASIAGNKNS
ncbi:hypothetical protein [Halostreptopolyspora alba]|uniref:Uncharacterized protein n=1 Tax=Halostreptopolyspora alba TaxID=2487137 RepID=A0A3N0E655_9ACTN|nr:hypothetical protein EFW17_16405 [Nocardiopsaceae bacterium YIM 96095]